MKGYIKSEKTNKLIGHLVVPKSSGGTSGYRTADISLKQAYQLSVVEKEFSVEEIQNVLKNKCKSKWYRMGFYIESHFSA